MNILVKTPKLINLRDYRGIILPSNTLKIDRTSEWGNPFRISEKYSRDEVIRMHKVWFLIGKGKFLQKKIMELLDYNFVACWCHPQPCHWINYWEYLIEKLRDEDMIDE